jgi:hypothetical protein
MKTMQQIQEEREAYNAIANALDRGIPITGQEMAQHSITHDMLERLRFTNDGNSDAMYPPKAFTQIAQRIAKAEAMMDMVIKSDIYGVTERSPEECDQYIKAENAKVAYDRAMKVVQ